MTRNRGKPITIDLAVGAGRLEEFEPPFVLHVRNGDETAGNRVSSATLSLDGRLVFDPSDSSQQVSALSAEVSLTEESALKVTLFGSPGGFVTIWIQGVPLPRRGDILFASAADGSSDIWAMNVDGTGRTNLSRVSQRRRALQPISTNRTPSLGLTQT